MTNLLKDVASMEARYFLPGLYEGMLVRVAFDINYPGARPDDSASNPTGRVYRLRPLDTCNVDYSPWGSKSADWDRESTEQVFVPAKPIGPVNQLPNVSAGSTQTVTLPASTAQLSGSASDSDGTVVSALWSQVSGPAAAMLTNASTLTPNVSGLTAAGTYVFRLTVTDDKQGVKTSDVTITVAAAAGNQLPSAGAGSAQTITLPTSTAQLSGSASDSDGTVASTAWSQVSGPTAATVVNASTLTPSVSGLTTAGTYVFRLTVTDNKQGVKTSDVTITVNPAAANQLPSAGAGNAQTITLPTSTAQLNGSASDSDGTVVSKVWSQVSGPAATITNGSTLTPTVSGLTAAGTYVFRLTVTDDKQGVKTSDVTITVNPVPVNQLPTASAGNAQTLTLPNSSIQLTGSASDSDGTVASTVWSQVSGPAAAIITDGSTLMPTVSGLTTAGTYVLRLTVTDNKQGVKTSDVTITVNTATVITPVYSETLSANRPEGSRVFFAPDSSEKINFNSLAATAPGFDCYFLYAGKTSIASLPGEYKNQPFIFQLPNGTWVNKDAAGNPLLYIDGTINL